MKVGTSLTFILKKIETKFAHCRAGGLVSEDFPEKLLSEVNSNMDLKTKVTPDFQFQRQFS